MFGYKRQWLYRTFQMCVILHSLNQLILQRDQLKDNAGEEEPTQTSFTNAIKPLFLLGSHVQFSSLSGEELSPFPTPGYILATLSSPFGWATPGNLGDFLWQQLRWGVAQGRRGSVVLRHPHLVMPKMTACYSRSDALLPGR